MAISDAPTPSRIQTAAELFERRSTRKRWLLVSPAMFAIFVCGIAPLLIVVIYSFSKPGEFGNVVMEFRTDAWVNVVFERDLFTEELGPNYAYYSIYLRSILMALQTTVLALIIGFPTAYFIATRPERSRNLWLFLITIPFWSNLLIRVYAIMMIIREDRKSVV